MDRKQIYAKIKELNLSEKIKKHFGDNYTRIPSAQLESFIQKATEAAKVQSKKTESKKCACTKDNPWFYLGSLLVAKRVITKQELSTLMEML